MQSFITFLLAATGVAAIAVVPKDTACTVASGQKGVCEAKTTCAKAGKVSVAGFCPGAADIECCITKAEAACPPNINAAALSLIESFEGWSATEYRDPDNLPTIGYGHLCSTDTCHEIGYPIPLSKANGAALLQKDLKIAEDCAAAHLSTKVKLNANQYGALTSFIFNVGCGNFEGSTLLKELNAGDNPDAVAAAQLPLWDRGTGGVLPGLQRRRAAEVKLFKTASSVKALPC